MSASPKHQVEIKSVSAVPEKNFFVNMLTRDIELHDAILDLLDNCVDGALRALTDQKKSATSLHGFWAKITLSKKRFVIEDNCGGIPWEIARDYAFNLGKPLEAEKPEGTIGVVGIGMKRAIFKMGHRCHVHSHHKRETFLVSIEPSWFVSPKWDPFPAEREASQSDGFGTIIEIDDLNTDTKLAFDEGSAFIERLSSLIGEAYAYLIDKGFKIFLVSGSGKPKEVEGFPIELCFESKTQKKETFRPFMYKAKHGEVDIFFAIGYRSRIESEEELNDKSGGSYTAGAAGWTVVCNDRVVLSNDRSPKTGWETGGVPRFHTQYSSIAGIVEFHSKDTKQLPVTTTKRGIDTGKDVYLLTLSKMQEATKWFTKNTNSWKGYEAEIKSRFDDLSKLGLVNLKKQAEPLLSTIPNRHGAKQYRPELPVKRQIVTTRRVVFVKPIKEIERVSRFLFDEVFEPSMVGEACFDRTLKDSQG